MKRLAKTGCCGWLAAVAMVVFSAASCGSKVETSWSPLKRDGVIPPRSADASPNLVDLSSYYTASLDDDWMVSAGSNLQPLPKGIQSFAGTTFDVRGLIQLSGITLLQAAGIDPATPHPYYPDAVNGIAVHAAAQRIHFLHAACWAAADGEKVGDYVVHYAGGAVAAIPILYLRQLRDWWTKTGDPMPTEATVAWAGQNEIALKRGLQVILFDWAWTNPQPAVQIDTVDFVSAEATSSPFLVAITLEPPN
jgi:hypothetical protein